MRINKEVFEMSEKEVGDARDAIVAHAKKWNRNNSQALAVFRETIRQLSEYIGEDT
jgi:hypothetical protein